MGYGGLVAVDIDLARQLVCPFSRYDGAVSPNVEHYRLRQIYLWGQLRDNAHAEVTGISTFVGHDLDFEIYFTRLLGVSIWVENVLLNLIQYIIE